jgi:hypothetical protein
LGEEMTAEWVGGMDNVGRFGRAVDGGAEVGRGISEADSVIVGIFSILPPFPPSGLPR